MIRDKILNLAVIAHVDAGKSTLVDALLAQSGTFRENETVVDCVMDSDAIERERGITIYSKNCSIEHEGIKINIVDTPGHADFSSEVERIMKTVDTVLLLVDSAEGPMPQTRFVLQKSLELGLKPVLFINKIDKKDARVDEVVDLTFDLFAALNANDEQLDFPIIYGIAKEGIAKINLDDESTDLTPLFDVLLEKYQIYPNRRNEPLQMQVSALEYDNYIGRQGVARVIRGVMKANQIVGIAKRDGSIVKQKIGKLYIYEGLKKVEVTEVGSGDICIFSGVSDISIGETVCDPDHAEALPLLKIDEPTLSMNFLVNNSPFAGLEGTYVTTRHIKDRLIKELETNVGLRIEELPNAEGFKVSGRGELHLSILLENMRREGFELAVSRPEVIMKTVKGRPYEPFEKLVITLPDEYGGTIISQLSNRKASLQLISSENDHTRLEFLAPTRGIIGYRNEFITSTKGEGVMVHSFDSFQPYAGEIESRSNGVLVSIVDGNAMAYSLFNLSERGKIMIAPGTPVYEGMIIGINAKNEDLGVNPIKNKQLTNMRASGSDDAIKLLDPKNFTLEEALEFIEFDELVEITPQNIRLRKKILDEKSRKKELSGKKKA